MLKHLYLFDPVKRTRVMRAEEFTKYVEIREAQLKDGRKVSDEVVWQIMKDFHDSHENVSNAARMKVWQAVGAKIQENEGLAQFILDYDGAKSDYFFPWLMAVYTSPSAALEMSYGAGYGLAGEWVYRTNPQDQIQDFIENDPTFVYNRERQLFVADLVSTIKDRAAGLDKTTVVDLGAGRMAWARLHGFQFSSNWQTIVAYDKDPSIDAERLFFASTEKLGLNYHHGDMAAAFQDKECQNADLIMLGGVASYYPMGRFCQNVMRPVHQMLKEKGVFFFDLQVDCPYLRRSMRIFDWPELVNFAASAADAIKMVEEVRKDLWKDGVKFGAEYALDTYNEVPSSVMITFTKID